MLSAEGKGRIQSHVRLRKTKSPLASSGPKGSEDPSILVYRNGYKPAETGQKWTQLALKNWDTLSSNISKLCDLVGES